MGVDISVFARKRKELAVEVDVFGGNLPTTAMGLKNGKLFVITVCACDKHAGLKMCWMLRKAFGCTKLWMANDTYQQSFKTMDELNEKATPGRLEKLVRTERAIEEGVVQESIVIVSCDEEKNVTIAMLPFVMQGSFVEWQEDYAVDVAGGFISESMQKIMEEPPADDSMLLAIPGMEDALTRKFDSMIRAAISKREPDIHITGEVFDVKTGERLSDPPSAS